MNTVSNFIPPSQYANATPELIVEVYPHEGGSYLFTTQNGGIVSANINKNIRDKEGGKFILNLSPGGPKGVDSPVSWTSIITPNSLAIIALSRGGSKRIVMVGVVLKITENQIWGKSGVKRTIQLIGLDFTYYFNNFSYYELTYLGLISNQNPTGVAGYILGMFGKVLMGPPATEAYLWLKNIMLGTGKTSPSVTAVLDNTFVTYKNKQQVFLRQLFGYWFEAFIEGASVVFVPFLTDLVNSEGSWFDKFLTVLAWPYYEFFITTGSATDYPALGTTNNLEGQTNGSFSAIPSINISMSGFNSVYPIIVGRVNPLPWITYTDKGTSGQQYFNRWNSLNIYSLGNYSFINSEVSYDTNEVANFFGVSTCDSSAIANTAGGSNANLFAFELIGGIIDHNSINSYGYRPKFNSTRWLTSLAPILNSVSGSKGTPNLNLDLLSSVLLGKYASYYIPTPNMLKGTISFPLWPDILPGNRFRYSPFKDNSDLYEFYIEGVTHVYEFGGNSYTMLDITRGLKKSDYSNTDILTGLHLDTYQRVDGNLIPRSAGAVGATYINPEIIANLGINVTPYYSPPKTINPPKGSS